MKKVLAVVLAIMMVLCTVPMTFASSDYDRAKVAADDEATVDTLSTEQIAGVLLDWVDRQIADVSADFGEFNTYAKLAGMSIPTNLDGIIAYKDQISVLGGDFANLDTSALTTRTAAGSDLQFIYNVIQFMADNNTTFAKVFAWEDGTTFDYGVVGDYIEDKDNNVDETIVNFYEDYLIGNDIQDKFITEIAREMGYTNNEGNFDAEKETFDEVLDNGIKGVVCDFLKDCGLMDDDMVATVMDDTQFDLKTTDVYTLVKHLFTLVYEGNYDSIKAVYTYICDNMVRPILKTAFGYTQTATETAASDAVLTEYKAVYGSEDAQELISTLGSANVLFQAADGKYYSIKADGTQGTEVTYGESFLNFEAPSVEIWDANQKVGGAYTPTSVDVTSYEPTVYTKYASYLGQDEETAEAVAAAEEFGIVIKDTTDEDNAIPEAITTIINAGNGVDMTEKFVMKINGKVMGVDLSEAPIEISFADVEKAVNDSIASNIKGIENSINESLKAALDTVNPQIQNYSSAAATLGIELPLTGSVTINSAEVALSYKGYSDADTFVCEVTAVPTIDVTYNGNVWTNYEKVGNIPFAGSMLQTTLDVASVKTAYGTFTISGNSVDEIVANVIDQAVTKPVATIVVDNLNGSIEGFDDLTKLMGYVDTDFDVDYDVIDFVANYDAYKGFVGQMNKVLTGITDMVLTDSGEEWLGLTKGGNEYLTANLQTICDKANNLVATVENVMNNNQYSDFIKDMGIDLDGMMSGIGADALYDIDFSSVEGLYVSAIKMGAEMAPSIIDSTDLDTAVKTTAKDVVALVKDYGTLEQMAVAVFNYAMPKAVEKVNDLFTKYGVSVKAEFTASTAAADIKNDAAAKDYIMTKAVALVYDVATQAVPALNKIINDAIAKVAKYLGITAVPTVAFELNVEEGATYEATLTNLFARFEAVTTGFFRDGVISGSDVYAKISSILNNFLPLSSMLSNAGVNGANGAIDVSYIMSVVFDKCLAGDFSGFLKMFEVKEDTLAGSDPVTYVLIKTSKHMVDPVFPGTVVPENTPASTTCQETFTGNANDQIIAANNMTSINTYKTSLVDFALKLVREAGVLPWFAKCNGAHTVGTKVEAVAAVHEKGKELQNGTKEYYTCSVCGVKVDEDGNELKDEDLVIVPEHEFTCTTDTSFVCTLGDCKNKTTYYKTCAVCGVSSNDANATFEGDYGAHTYVKNADDKYLKTAATCKAQAEYYTSCAVCGVSSNDADTTFKAGDLKAHNMTAIKTVAPTCTEEGYTIYQCSECHDAVENRDYVAAKGHVDADNNGSCDNCGAEMEKEEEGFFTKIVNFFKKIIDWFKNLFK